MIKSKLLDELAAWNGYSFQHIETKLTEQFVAGMNALSEPGPHPKIVNPNSKWRVSSCMQKAIRRGEVETAVKMASALMDHDPSYFLRRINVVAMEDIGLANPALVAQILCMSGKQVFLQKYGLVKVAQHWARELAKGIKDRTLCELTCMTDYGKAYAGFKHTLHSYNYDGFHAGNVENVLAACTTTEERVIAARYMAGTKKFDSDNFMHVVGCYDAFCEWITDEYPPLVAYLAIKGSKKATQLLWIGVPETYNLLRASTSIGVESQDVAVSPMIKGVRSYAYDMHTLEGKKAYSYLWKACQPINEYMVFNGLKPNQIYAPAFIAESGVLDQHIVFDGFTDLMSRARIAEFDSSGLTEQHGWALVKLLTENMQSLHEARAAVNGVVL